MFLSNCHKAGSNYSKLPPASGLPNSIEDLENRERNNRTIEIDKGLLYNLKSTEEEYLPSGTVSKACGEQHSPSEEFQATSEAEKKEDNDVACNRVRDQEINMQNNNTEVDTNAPSTEVTTPSNNAVPASPSREVTSLSNMEVFSACKQGIIIASPTEEKTPYFLSIGAKPTFAIASTTRKLVSISSISQQTVEFVSIIVIVVLYIYHSLSVLFSLLHTCETTFLAFGKSFARFFYKNSTETSSSCCHHNSAASNTGISSSQLNFTMSSTECSSSHHYSSQKACILKTSDQQCSESVDPSELVTNFSETGKRLDSGSGLSNPCQNAGTSDMPNLNGNPHPGGVSSDRGNGSHDGMSNPDPDGGAPGSTLPSTGVSHQSQSEPIEHTQTNLLPRNYTTVYISSTTCTCDLLYYNEDSSDYSSPSKFKPPDEAHAAPIISSIGLVHNTSLPTISASKKSQLVPNTTVQPSNSPEPLDTCDSCETRPPGNLPSIVGRRNRHDGLVKVYTESKDMHSEDNLRPAPKQ